MELQNERVWDNFTGEITNVSKSQCSTCGAGCFFDATKPLFLQSLAPKHPSIQCYSKDSCSQQYFQKSILKNYSNFLKSGLPHRLLFYKNGGWEDYPVGIIPLIQEDFQAKKAITEIVFQGHCMLFDFVRMVEIDADTGLPKSLAWIDEHGSSFFPGLCPAFVESHMHLHSGLRESEVYTSTEPNDDPETKMKLAASSTELSPFEECKDAYYDVKSVKTKENPSRYVKKHAEVPKLEETVGENEPSTLLQLKVPLIGCLPEKIAKLGTGGNAYRTVQNMLLLGMRTFIEEKDIFGIFNIPPTSSFGQMRLKLFQKQVDITCSQRGDANIRYAWLASSKKDAEKIMYQGLSEVEKPSYVPMHGTGIHLSSAKCSNLSVVCSDVDENDTVHVVLCRVILGNLEQVCPGSKQSQPSSGSYDNGIDNFQNPNHYIIWDTHADTHILPEYIVRIKLSRRAKGSLFEKRSTSHVLGVANSIFLSSQASGHSCIVESEKSCMSNKSKFPKSPWMPFSMLFAAISTKISSHDMNLVSIHYDEFKKENISRIDLIKKLRQIIGDKLMISTITQLQYKFPLAGRRNQSKHTPHRLPK